MTIRIVNNANKSTLAYLDNRLFVPNVGDHVIIKSNEFIVRDRVYFCSEESEREVVRIFVSPANKELGECLM